MRPHLTGRRRRIGSGRWPLVCALVGLAVTLPPVYAAARASSSDLAYPVVTKPAFPATQGNMTGRTGASVDCPDKRPHVLGGGVEITGVGGNGFPLDVASTRPVENRGGTGAWEVASNNNSLSSAQQSVTAICAESGAYQYPFRIKTVPAGKQVAARTPCPVGTEVTGGGVETDSSSSKVNVATSVPFDGPDQDSQPDNGWVGAANNGSSNPEDMAVWAVCALSGDYTYPATHVIPLQDNSGGTFTKQCPAGDEVSGGGVDNSGTNLGDEVGSTFPTADHQGWTASAINDNTGEDATMQVFAICKEPKVRLFSGAVDSGGTVTFRVKLDNGKPRRVLPNLLFDNVPISCTERDTTHGTIFDDALRVRHGSFAGHGSREDSFPQAKFAFNGHFNQSGTEASGTYREHGNLINEGLNVHLTHCDTGTVHWSAIAAD